MFRFDQHMPWFYLGIAQDFAYRPHLSHWNAGGLELFQPSSSWSVTEKIIEKPFQFSVVLDTPRVRLEPRLIEVGTFHSSAEPLPQNVIAHRQYQIAISGCEGFIRCQRRVAVAQPSRLLTGQQISLRLVA
jgi:hypothetical protein